MINNLNSKTKDEVCKFYNNEQNKIDFSCIYYYIKNKDINNKKLFKKNVKLSH